MDEQQQPLINLEYVSKIFYTEEIETHMASRSSARPLASPIFSPSVRAVPIASLLTASARFIRSSLFQSFDRLRKGLPFVFF